ncbi:MAG TPA: CinA family protein [Mycobacteriales bacterium]
MTLADQVHVVLRARDQTVAVAESLTAGLLSAALTDTPGASSTFRGGLVVYATDLKASLAGVPGPLLDAQGPVSPDVAAALAAGTRTRLGATWGLAVTGVAGPDEQDGVAVGTVFVGIAGPDQPAGAGSGAVRALHLAGDRAEIRRQAVLGALEVLAGALGVGRVESAQ